MKTKLFDFQGLYGFHIVNDDGKRLWTGNGFLTPSSRSDAIQVAHRELQGLPPIFNEAAMQKETAAVLRAWRAQRFPRVAAA